MKSRLAVLILTKNEEANIAAAVQNVRQCGGEVVIVDSGSTDRTAALAEAAGARVAYRAWDHDFSAQRNFALTQTDADWVLYLDADERLNEELIKAIRRVSEQDPRQPGQRKKYSLCRKTVAFGTTFEHGAMLPDHVVRLFPRDAAYWVNKVHERPECSLPEEKLPGYIEHYSYRNWQDWLRKVDLYTDIWAEDAAAKGKRATAADGFLHGATGLGKVLMLRAGFLDGWPGVYMCFCHAFYTMMKYLKLYERQQK